jgi:hypothetical protein
MSLAVFYFGSFLIYYGDLSYLLKSLVVVLAAQMLASIGVLSINSWMVNTLINQGNQVTDDNKWAWASFYGLMTMALLSIIVPLVQGLCMGCFCCGGCVRRPLAKGQYTAQCVFLGVQAVLWMAAAGWALFVLLNNQATFNFGNIQYLDITCSWLAP